MDEAKMTGGAAGGLLDRLLLLEQFMPAEDVLRVLRDTGCIDKRRCALTFEVTCWLVLAMGVFTDLPMRAAFKACVSLHRLAFTPARPSLCEARQRLGVAPLRRLFYRFARPLARPGTPGAFYKGLRLVAIDSTGLTAADSPANARAFGRASAGAARGEAAFPQVRKTSLVELGSRAELAFAVKGINAPGGEQGVAPSLLRHLGPAAPLLLDAGLYSYRLWRQAVAKADALLRLSSALKLPALKVPADGSHLSKVYPAAACRKRDEGGVWVRVVRYTHDDERRVNCGKEHRLLTALLDAAAFPPLELIALYHERWEVEMTYDEQKTPHAPRVPGKEARLRSETPAGVVQGMYALSPGRYLTRAFMSEAAATQGLDPDRLSFVGCLRVLRNRTPDLAGPAGERRAGLYRAPLAETAGERLPPRRNRINPRVVKVKMSKFNKKRAEHRPSPPLTKTFMESVVVR